MAGQNIVVGTVSAPNDGTDLIAKGVHLRFPAPVFRGDFNEIVT
jgi:hypothetical protein